MSIVAFPLGLRDIDLPKEAVLRCTSRIRASSRVGSTLVQLEHTGVDRTSHVWRPREELRRVVDHVLEKLIGVEESCRCKYSSISMSMQRRSRTYQHVRLAESA